MKCVPFLLTLGITLLAGTAWGQCVCEAKYGACLCQDCDDNCDCLLTYAEAWDAAIRQRKPLLVFVKQKARPVAGCVVCRADTFEGQPVPGVVFGLPDDKGQIDRVATQDGCPAMALLTQRIRQLQAERARSWARQQAGPVATADPRGRPPTGPSTFRGCASGTCFSGR